MSPQDYDTEKVLSALRTTDLFYESPGNKTIIVAAIQKIEGYHLALKEIVSCLRELHATVWGECPSLLDEDSGGNASLDLRIEAILKEFN